jgi:hypothetical protein
MADQPREIALKLVTELRGVLGARIDCAVLYGSAARGEFTPGVSDVNVMVLLDDINTGALSAAAPIAARWVKSGHTPPLIMEREQWRRASDVFAIELADMRDAHEALFGEDCVAGTMIERRHLRAQAERELRGKLLHLQTGLLMTATQPESVGELLKKALPSFTTYLRAAIRMNGGTVPATTPEVIRQGTQRVGAPADPWLAVWAARKGGEKLRLAMTDTLVEQYHSAAERTADFVDTLREDEQ